MNYTKGEWKIDRQNGDIYTQIKSQSGLIDYRRIGRLETDNPNAKDNARLITAAPEMYEVLKMIIKSVDKPLNSEIKEMIVKALSKVEGNDYPEKGLNKEL